MIYQSLYKPINPSIHIDLLVHWHLYLSAADQEPVWTLFTSKTLNVIFQEAEMLSSSVCTELGQDGAPHPRLVRGRGLRSRPVRGQNGGQSSSEN